MVEVPSRSLGHLAERVCHLSILEHLVAQDHLQGSTMLHHTIESPSSVPKGQCCRTTSCVCNVLSSSKTREFRHSWTASFIDKPEIIPKGSRSSQIFPRALGPASYSQG